MSAPDQKATAMPPQATSTRVPLATTSVIDPVQPQSDPLHYVPDVDGLTLAEAALAYAEAGWYVVPVMPGSKSPGSVVGSDWPDKSSCDSQQIEQWWD